MSRIARNQADARLSRDGSVKLKGKRVGVWWKDGDFDVFHVYHFALKQGQDPILSRTFRHEIMTAIAEYFADGQSSQDS